jgi:hypothetical protein
LQPELEDLLLLGRSYERLFDDFEVFLTLVFRDARGDDWGPIGRFGYKQRRGFGDSPYDRVVNEAKAAAQNWPPVKVGMFKGSYDEFIKGADLFRENFKHLHW